MGCEHVAIIMDGNGRWAKAQGKPRTAGHLVGADNVRTIAIAANELGVKYLTLYAFSTENWKRSADEVNYIMKLPAVFFKKYMQEFLDRGYRMNIIGELDKLPKNTEKVLRDAMDESRNNTGLNLNICMNYGSQREIVLAANAYAKDVLEGKKELGIDTDDIGAGSDQLLSVRKVHGFPLRLHIGSVFSSDVRSFIPVDSHIPERPVNHIHRSVHVAFQVRILNPEQKPAACMAGVKKRIKRASEVADMHISRR